MAARLGRHTCRMCKPWKWHGNARWGPGPARLKASERRRTQPDENRPRLRRDPAC